MVSVYMFCRAHWTGLAARATTFLDYGATVRGGILYVSTTKNGDDNPQKMYIPAKRRRLHPPYVELLELNVYISTISKSLAREIEDKSAAETLGTSPDVLSQVLTTFFLRYYLKCPRIFFYVVVSTEVISSKNCLLGG